MVKITKMVLCMYPIGIVPGLNPPAALNLLIFLFNNDYQDEIPSEIYLEHSHREENCPFPVLPFEIKI